MPVEDRPLWVAVLNISDRTASKIVERHGVEVDELRQSVVAVAGLDYVWHVHPDRGLRAIVSTTIGRRKVLVLLYPTDDPDMYWLGSAHPRDGGTLRS